MLFRSIHLERLLVGKDIDLDSRKLTRQARHRASGAPIVGMSAIDKVAIIVAGAVGSAVPQELWRGMVGADLLGG